MAFDWVRGDKIRKTVILDSSAILTFFEFSLDWEKDLDRLVGAYHLLVPTAVVRELQILAKQGNRQKKASAALRLIAKYPTVEEEVDSADEALLKIAEKTFGIVVTNDRGLRERLKEHKIPVIFVRGKKKLVLDE
jgi:rRNA-processing protein FCF1